MTIPLAFIVPATVGGVAAWLLMSFLRWRAGLRPRAVQASLLAGQATPGD